MSTAVETVPGDGKRKKEEIEWNDTSNKLVRQAEKLAESSRDSREGLASSSARTELKYVLLTAIAEGREDPPCHLGTVSTVPSTRA